LWLNQRLLVRAAQRLRKKEMRKPMGMSRAVLSVALAVGFVSSAIPVHAEETAQAQTPEQVVQAYYTAMRAGNWTQWATLFHPQAAQRFQSMTLPVIQQMAAQAEQAGQSAEFLAPFGVKTREELAKVSPQAFLAGFMSSLSAANPMMKQSLATQTAKVIGVVDEGPMKHVVVRASMTGGGTSISKMSVVSLERDGKEWRMQLSGDIEGLAQAFRARAKPPQPAGGAR